MASQQEKSKLDLRVKKGETVVKLDSRVKKGETVVPGATGGRTLLALDQLLEGRERGGDKTKQEQLGTEVYQEIGREGELATINEPEGERTEEEGIENDKSSMKKCECMLHLY